MVTFMEKRKHNREPYNDTIEFIVLLTKASELKRISSTGKIIDVSLSGIGVETNFPLEAGHVIEWDDKHQKGKLHLALVKWSRKLENLYRAGLMYI